MRSENNTNNELKINFRGDISTYMASYRLHKNIRTERYRPRREDEERPPPEPQPRIILDLETYTPLKHQIPLGLMAFPNDITGSNPLTPIRHIEVPEDDKKEEVIKTRPRVYKPPQVCLDEVQDSEIRKMLVDYTYTSQSRKTNHDLCNMIGIEVKETPETVSEHDQFLTTSNKHNFGVCFNPKSQLQIIMTPEQNMRSQTWQKDRIVGIANSTEHFWKEQIPKYGSSYNDVLNLVEKRTVEEIGQLVEDDKLAVQHDRTSPGYAGYKSNVAVGVDIHKKDIPLTHPLLSTYREAFSWKMKRNISKSIS